MSVNIRMKKVFSILLCLCMLVQNCPVVAFAAETTEPVVTGDSSVTVHSAPEVDLPENGEIFALYAEQKLYGYEMATFGTAARANLNSVEQRIYDALKAKIEAVATSGGSTVFTVSAIEGLKTDWSNTDLNVTYITDADVEAAVAAQFNPNSIVTALLNDCPFDLYWYDKTETGGAKASYQIGYSGAAEGQWTSASASNLTFTFAVTDDYKIGDNYVTTEVSKVTAAANEAQRVVTENASKSDSEKLVAYKEYICNAVSYNSVAASESYTGGYGDPWQLIYVFDGDSSTNVVCEGYSKAFQYLCDLGGLDCICAEGTMTGATGAGPHMWNVVTLDGANYLVDVTNCDEGTAGAPDALFLVGGTYADGGYAYTIGSQTVTYTCADLSLAATDYDAGAQIPDPVCTCESKCSEGSVNSDCAVCSAEGADLTACEGTAEDSDAVASVTVGSTTTYYETLPAAFTAAQASENSTLTLLKDIDMGEEELLITSGTFTIDLNDCTYTSTCLSAIRVEGATVTITDNGPNKTGTVQGEFNGVEVTNYGTVNITGGTITARTGIFSYVCGTINISGGTVIGTGTSGNDAAVVPYASYSVVNISGGTITGSHCGVYVWDGNANITGGSISGTECDLYISAGSLKLTLAEGKTEGARFPGGITVEGKTLAELLSDTVAYWAVVDGKDTMLTVADDATGITDKGDITIRAACGHGDVEYAPNADGTTHTWTCGVCQTAVTEEHSTGAEGDKALACTTPAYCSVCGSEYGEPVGHNWVNGFCTNEIGGVVCDDYEPATPVTNENYAELGLTEDYIGYYALENAGQLYWFAEKVDNENDTYKTANVVLTADINVNVGGMNENTTGAREWNPIGYWNSGRDCATFNGTFDGNNKKISGLYANNTDDDTGWNVALIAQTESDALVKNVTVTNAWFEGHGHVAGIVGKNGGTISGCVNEASLSCDWSYIGGMTGVNNGTVTGCINRGRIAGENNNSGGIVGHNGGTVELCGNVGSISDDWCFAGGIAGNNAGIIRNCWNTGKVDVANSIAGGIAGMNNPGDLLENCWSTGAVSCGRDPEAAGGIVGLSEDATQRNCYSVMKPVAVIEDKNGVSTVENMDPITQDQLASGEVAYLLRTRAAAGTDVWGQNIDNDETVQTVPVLNGADVYYGYFDCSSTEAVYTNKTVSATPVEHDYDNGFCELIEGETHYEPAVPVTADNYTELGLAESYIGYYAITNAGNLYWFSDKVDNENATYGSANVVLTADITVNEGRVTANGTGRRIWNPIGRYNRFDTNVAAVFSGTFDGNGKTVSGLYFSDEVVECVALIAYTSETAVVKNVTLTNSYFFGESNVAGIVGSSYGTVSGCFNEAAISGESQVGGIVGLNAGIVELCGNTGSVSSESRCAGGIAGSNRKTIRNCWNTANIHGGTVYIGGIAGANNGDYGAVPLIENCWSTGNASSSMNANPVGGIVGRAWNNRGGVRNCYSLMKPVGVRVDGHPVTNTETKTLDQFASGEVAYLLRTRAAEGTNAWGQDLDNGKTVQQVPTFNGAAVYYGYISCADDAEIVYTNNAKASETKPEHTGNINYTLTEDGTQHIGTYECCGMKFTEDHDFDNDAHKCVCGKVETFTVYWTMASSLMQGTSTYGQDFTQTFTVPENTHLRINGVQLADTPYTPVNYTYENGILTIAAADLPAADVYIDCYHYVEVKFDANGGVIKPHEGYPVPGDTGFAEDGSYWIQKFAVGQGIDSFFVNAEVSRTGYNFVEWRDASGKVYPMAIAGNVEPYVLATEDVTLYAQWQCSHTIGGVEFRDNGSGSHDGYCGECGEPLGNYVERPHAYDETTHQCVCGAFKPFNLYADGQTLTVAYGSDLDAALADITPEKTGYTHTGDWTYYSLDEDGIEEPYTGTTMPAMELYAKPVYEAIEYTITWDMAGCSYYVSNYYDGLPAKLAYNVDSNDHNVNFTDITAPEGYEFVRFEDGDGNALSYAVSDHYRLYLTVSGDMTVKAVIQPKTYKATWVSFDGSSRDVNFKYGEIINVCDHAPVPGHTFIGWEGYTEGMTMPAKDVTFTAIYQVNQYTITFNTDGGSEVASITQDYGTAVMAPEAPSKAGYHFVEWQDLPATMPAENVTIKAVWEAHYGGEATCVIGKLCEVCFVEYTDVDADAHGELLYTVSQDGATCTVRCALCQEVWEAMTLVAPACNTYGDGKSCEVTILLEDIPVAEIDGEVYFRWENDRWNKLEAAPTDAGIYRAEVYNAGAPFDTSDDFTLYVEYIIAKKELTAAVSGSATKSYDGTNAVPEGHGLKIALNGVISGDTVSASADFVFAGINAGTKTINATNIALSGEDVANYVLKTTTASADVGEIIPLDLTYLELHDYEIVFGAEPVYNGKEQTMTLERFVMCGLDVTYELAGNTGTEAGIYTLTITGTGNFEGTATAEWSIAKKNISGATITLGDSLTYNGKEQTQDVAEVKIGDLTVTYDVTDNKQLGAGNYTLTVTGNGNFEGSATADWSIAKAKLTITANDNSITFGDVPTANGVTGTGFVSSESLEHLSGELTYSYNYEQFGNVGTYKITPSGVTSNNYEITFADGTLTVDAKPITITADAVSKTYGEADPKLTYKVEGLVNGDELTGELKRAAGENVGDYAIEQNTLTAGNNYRLTYTGANLTINAKAITVADVKLNGSLTYNGKEQTQPITVTEGIIYEVSGNKATNVGTYELTVKGTGNYTGSVTLDWTIAKAKLTITADSKVIYIGEQIPTLTYTASGLAGGDKLSKEPVLTTNADADQAGSYTITAANAEAGDNYTITYVSGSLTIMDKETEVETKIEQTELTEVPEGLKDTQFDTVEEIKEELISKILATSTGYSAENMVHYDVRLYFSLDGGDSWILATEENFPTEGITVVLPYPEGTNARDYEFVVSHMFTVTSQRLGTVAGEVELPKVEETANGIRVTLNGLSPVTVAARYHDHTGGRATCTDKAICDICGNAYGELDATNHAGGTEVKNAKEATCGAEGYTGDTHCKGCGEIVEKGTAIKATGEHTYGNWKIVKKATKTEKGEKQRTCSVCGHVDSEEIPMLSDVPATGDNSNIILYGSMFTVSLAGLVVLVLVAKKRKQENA